MIIAQCKSAKCFARQVICSLQKLDARRSIGCVSETLWTDLPTHQNPLSKHNPSRKPGMDQLRQIKQEAQLSPSDHAMRLVSSNLANCMHATVQKLLIRQVLTKLMV